MGKSTPSQPAAPDPVATANAQAAANREASIASQEMSMVNQLTPQGSLTYEQTGTSDSGNPQYTATQSYSPEQREIYDLATDVSRQFGETAQAQLGTASDKLSAPIDYSQFGPAPEANEATRTASRDAILQRLQPQMDRDRAALQASLANQGFVTGSEGYNSALDENNRARNDAYLAADAQGGSEMALMYGLESAARDRGINELIQQRQVPLNELSAMMSGSQVQGPQFVSTPGSQVSPSPLAESIYASANIDNKNWARQSGAQSAQQQGLMGLLGTGAMAGAYSFSDRRLKTDIKQVGILANGLPVYKYRYKFGGPEQVGLMADEVKLIHPCSVARFGEYDAVNYAEAVK